MIDTNLRERERLQLTTTTSSGTQESTFWESSNISLS